MSEPAYKAILVDDEPIILRSLEAAVPWEELGVRLVGQARNGEEALQLFHSSKPDIIVSDIRMPSIDGIALMTEVMRLPFKPIFIVISGYGDFEYAREAIRQGAFDYLLKPIDHDELIGMVRKATGKLDAERRARAENEQLLHSVQALSLLARERMFAELIEGNQRPLQHMQWMESSLLEKPYCVAVVQLDHFATMNKRWTPQEKRLWFFAVRNILEEWSQHNEGLAAFPFHSGEWILLFEAAPGQRLRSLGEDIVRHIMQYSKLSCSVGISSQAQGIEQLHGAYQSACGALQQRFHNGGESVFLDGGGGDTAARTAAGAPAWHYPKRLETELVSCIRSLDRARMLAALDALKEELGATAAPKDYLIRCAVEITVIVHREFQHMSLSAEHSVDAVLQSLQDAATLDDAVDTMKRAFAGWLERNLESRDHEDGAALMEKARRYIDNHYHNDLGIDEVSDFVGLSASHFCTLFKQVTGSTFLEYVTWCRIEKAKYILLNTEVKVYQLAPLVGYQDPRYFTQVFKKITGMTPSEYRAQA